MPDVIRANSVEVAKVFQARCRICPWLGENRDSYQEANSDRQEHLATHRAGSKP